VPEGLEHEQIAAAFRESRRLVGERGARERELLRAVRAGNEAGRSDRAGDVGSAAHDLPRDLRSFQVVAPHLAHEAVALEPEAVRPEGVRLDDLRSRVEVVRVDLLDDVGSRDVQLLEVLGDEDAALVEERPHRPVRDEQRTLHGLEEGGERRRGGVGGSHRGLTP
jgi:hypothetical protein